ncbi:MAG TPA: hypothetical protein VIF62_32200 [Labilithrix sp.]
MRSSLVAISALSMSGLVGCGLPSSADQADAEAASQTATAIVVVERGNGGDAVVARFVRVRQGAVDDPALRLAGVPDLPSPTRGCWVPSEATVPSVARQVDLLDVGNVTLDRTSLYARAMPDPAGVVSGVFYSARTAEPSANAANVQLRASGGEDLPDGFAITVPAPRELDDVSAAVGPNANAIDVAWEAGDGSDVVYVDVLSASQPVLRCASFDLGRLQIPTTLEDGELAVHRVHREAFHAKGVEPGEIRFDVSRTTSFHR